MPQRRRRFDDTTEHLLGVAEHTLLAGGVRAVTLEALAERGFASVGSVYERWGSRAALLDDLVVRRLGTLLELFSDDQSLSLDARLRLLMDTSAGEKAGMWLVELLHLARDVPSLAHHADGAIDTVTGWLRLPNDPSTMDAADRGIAHWLVANVIGHAQLRLGGAHIPSMADAMARLARRPGDAPAGLVYVSTVSLPVPSTPDETEADEVTQRLVGVTRRLIAEAGGDTSIRAVLAETGMAAGSLYRRFESKRALMLEVLQHELRTAPYEWIQGLLDATSTTDPIGTMASVFARRFDSLYADAETRNVILELTAQARSDDVLRRTVIAQVEHVAQVRATFFERFAEAGVLSPEISPTVCGWLVQCPAAGYRLMIGAGLQPRSDEVEAAVARVFWNLLSP